MCSCGGILKRTFRSIQCFLCDRRVKDRYFYQVLSLDQAKKLIDGDSIYFFDVYQKKYGHFNVRIWYEDGEYMKEYSIDGKFNEFMESK